MTKFGDRQVGVVGREAGVAGRQAGRMERKHGGRQAGGNGGEREACRAGWWVVRPCIDLPNSLQQKFTGRIIMKCFFFYNRIVSKYFVKLW